MKYLQHSRNSDVWALVVLVLQLFRLLDFLFLDLKILNNSFSATKRNDVLHNRGNDKELLYAHFSRQSI